MEGDIVQMQEIYKFVRTGTADDGAVIGHFQATGVRPRFLADLTARGIRIPGTYFDPNQPLFSMMLVHTEGRLNFGLLSLAEQEVLQRATKVIFWARPDQWHVRHARAVGGLGEDHAEADLLDQRFEQRAIIDAEQRVGMHQRFPPVGSLLGAPSVRVRRSPRRALR